LKQRRVQLRPRSTFRTNANGWLANRDYQELFAAELESALRILAILPGAGTLYTQSGTLGLRRFYLRKLSCHLNYTFDDEQVIVRASSWPTFERCGALAGSAARTSDRLRVVRPTIARQPRRPLVRIVP
jgi:hypothetical protein